MQIKTTSQWHCSISTRHHVHYFKTKSTVSTGTSKSAMLNENNRITDVDKEAATDLWTGG